MHIVKLTSRKIEKNPKKSEKFPKKGVFDPKTGKIKFFFRIFFFRNGTVSSPLNPMIQRASCVLGTGALTVMFVEPKYSLKIESSNFFLTPKFENSEFEISKSLLSKFTRNSESSMFHFLTRLCALSSR